MRVIIAPDKFKGTLTAPQAAAAMAAGWRDADPRAEIDQVPVADGGEGTLDALVAALGGERRRARVTGPLGDPVDAEYGLATTEEGVVAIVEMAQASGLRLVSEARRDPRRATTRGTGELILEACRHRPSRLLIGVGGSATNDAGAGMAQALGVRLLDETGRDLPSGGAALRSLARVDLRGLHPSVRDLDVVVICDVDNPLVGPSGASATYGPQKGAMPRDVADLEEALGHFAAVAHRDVGIDLRHLPRAGAAGGLGAGLLAFLGARLRPGFEVVADVIGLRARLAAAEVAVTGEGRYDLQTARGKAPGGVLRLAAEAGCRTVLIAGQVEEGSDPPAEVVYSLSDRGGSEGALARAEELVREAAGDAARTIMAGGAVARTKAVERVREAAARLGLELDVREFPEGPKTAADAARAVGCEVGQIVKSLVFVAGSEPFVALTSGPNRADTARLSELMGGRPVRRATPDEAREATGFSIGGTPPFGHPRPLQMFVDRDLLAHDVVWAAAGTPQSVFPISPADLVAVTEARGADFKER